MESKVEKTLVLFAHPFLEYSVFNAHLISFYQDRENVTFRDLYEEYPNFHIAAFRERKRIKNYDKLIFQFPLIWLGIPPLLNLWLSEVLDMKWLSKQNENPLAGKKAMIIVSAGGSENSYTKSGMYEKPIEDFILPLTKSLETLGVSVEKTICVYAAKQKKIEEVNEIQQEISKFLS
ncbi:NAD(P)H-dependent oxidoreductase [Riemerella anatipestifer]|uniref:NAD(P)H-dependent oxidoreductase n=1 Tax=Riemerella anatipestifer TaxID=34085 RepID=UPI00129E9766|nr:NAD(P)H-dependent oxidoreductase [Riemerella anatipestifer]MRM82404.1 flavodoxin family protein [Riemerella anatipestifer]